MITHAQRQLLMLCIFVFASLPLTCTLLTSTDFEMIQLSKFNSLICVASTLLWPGATAQALQPPGAISPVAENCSADGKVVCINKYV